VIFQCDATTNTGGGELRCMWPRGHKGAHVGRDTDTGTLRVWPPVADPPVTQSTATLDELLEHLRDLAEHAGNAGFHLFAARLLRDLAIVERYRSAFEPRPSAASLESSSQPS
jgi:hypothetical protein